MLADTEITASKSRFGLFSQPPPIALGDDSYYNSKTGTFTSIQQEKERMANR